MIDWQTTYANISANIAAATAATQLVGYDLRSSLHVDGSRYEVALNHGAIAAATAAAATTAADIITWQARKTAVLVQVEAVAIRAEVEGGVTPGPSTDTTRDDAGDIVAARMTAAAALPGVTAATKILLAAFARDAGVGAKPVLAKVHQDVLAAATALQDLVDAATEWLGHLS